MSTTDATSPMRQAVIAAITVRAARDPDAAKVLVGELAAAPYAGRTDAALFGLAEQVGVPADKLAKIALLDTTLVPVRPRHICGTCEDTGQVARGDGRFVRCDVCNPEPRTEEL